MNFDDFYTLVASNHTFRTEGTFYLLTEDSPQKISNKTTTS